MGLCGTFNPSLGASRGFRVGDRFAGQDLTLAIAADAMSDRNVLNGGYHGCIQVPVAPGAYSSQTANVCSNWHASMVSITHAKYLIF